MIEVRRTDLEVNPDWEALGAFEIHIPEDTVLIDVDHSGMKYRWSGGELLPYIDPKVEQSMELMVRDLNRDSITTLDRKAPADREIEVAAATPGTHAPVASTSPWFSPLLSLALIVVLAGTISGVVYYRKTKSSRR